MAVEIRDLFICLDLEFVRRAMLDKLTVRELPIEDLVDSNTVFDVI